MSPSAETPVKTKVSASSAENPVAARTICWPTIQFTEWIEGAGEEEEEEEERECVRCREVAPGVTVPFR